MACVVLMSTSQVMAFEDRNRKLKIVMNYKNENHEEVADKLKRRFEDHKKLED